MPNMSLIWVGKRNAWSYNNDFLLYTRLMNIFCWLGRDSLMPKERCPVCAIEITHKNLARHIKLRHGIRYKFCYKCRKLVPGHLYAEHKALHDNGQLESVPVGGDKYAGRCEVVDFG